MDLTPVSSIEEFFRGELTKAFESQGIETTEATEFYLVHLLGEFATTRITDEALGLKLVQHNQSRAAQIESLKQVGDTSLYVAGFFAESLERKLVDVDYYMGVGGAAYRQLARAVVSGGGSRTIADVYEELAAKFPRFVDVLHEVRNEVSFVGGDVVQLYREWLRTRSDWVERRLRAMGLIVPDAGEGYLQ